MQALAPDPLNQNLRLQVICTHLKFENTCSRVLFCFKSKLRSKEFQWTLQGQGSH